MIPLEGDIVRNNYFKYIFIFVVLIIVLVTVFFLYKQKGNEENETVIDQTSTVSNIQRNLRLAIAGYDTINPILSNNRNVQEISKIIYDSLVTLDNEYKMKYSLAKEVSKVDGVTYLIKLREDVKWQDSTPFSANDVKFTIDAIKSENVNSIYEENLKYVTELQIIDEYTVKIILSQEVPFFEYNLTFPIMSEKYYQNEDFVSSSKNNKPIGTGMFKIESNENNLIKLSKNNSYWDVTRDAMIEEVNIMIYNNIGEVYEAFKMGNVDIINVKSNNISQYIGTIGYNKIEYKSREYDFVAINTMHPVLSDSSVRKAINLAIDKDNLIATVYGGGYEKSEFPLDYGSWLNAATGGQEYDPDGSNQILIDAGWEFKNGKWQKLEDGRYKNLNFSITVSSEDSVKIAVAENIATQLDNIGINVTVRKVSNTNYYESINNGNFDMILVSFNNSFSPNLSTFFDYEKIAGYSNEEVHNIMNEVKNITDEELLNSKYYRLYEIFVEEVPYISLYRKKNCVVCNTSLVGNITPNNYNIFHNIEKWYRQ